VHNVNIAMRQRHEHKQLSMIVDRIESYDAVEIPNEECVKVRHALLIVTEIQRLISS
jgi:hypothetical protein